MQLEAFDPISPSRALAFREEAQTLAIIVDGLGSWGSGREAADRARENLARRWPGLRSSVESLRKKSRVLPPLRLMTCEIVTHAARFNLAGLRTPQSAEALAAMAYPEAYPGPVIIARPQQAA